MSNKTEAQLQEQIAQYIRLRYPDVLFHSDFGSGIKLTKGQAVRQKRQNGGLRAWPDMLIAKAKKMPKDELRFEPQPGVDGYGLCPEWHGLFIELKREGTRLKKKDGSWASEHIAEQAEVLQKLEDEDYIAMFAVGFDQAKMIIDDYLG